MAMDESAFRDARNSVNPQPCAFEKALLARCCQCGLAQRMNIGEREAVGCTDAAQRQTCLALRGQLQQNAAFALKLTHTQEPLPHVKEMKIQCGGLRGLQKVLSGGAEAGEGSDGMGVSALVRLALERYITLDRLPYSEIMQTVAAFEIRRRRVT
jgi:hypothetical protein